MTPAEIAALKQEIANTESTIRILLHHADSQASEADEL